MTIRKTVAITAALLLLVLNTVSAQDEWDALDTDEEEEASDDEKEGDEYEDEDEDEERPPEPESFPDQARDDEGFFEPVTDDEKSGEEASGEEEPLPTAAPKEDKPISVGLLAGYGFSFEEGNLNAFGLGFGFRGGYTFDMGIYAGVKFIYFLGGEEGVFTQNIVTIGVEGGYKLELDPFVFVPSLELGLALVEIDDSTDIADQSLTEFYLAPGISVLYPFDMLFIGVDLSIPIIFRDPTIEGLSLMATCGMSF